jgi:hypothetical protein
VTQPGSGYNLHMASPRTRDRFVGALVGVAVTLLLLVLAAAVLFWSVSEPAGGTTAAPSPTASSPGTGTGTPPDAPAEGETWLGAVGFEAGTVLTSEAELLDVEATGDDVVAGPDGIRAGRLDVTGTVPFALVAARLGEGTTVSADGSRAAVLRTVEVAGRELRVVATGDVEVEGGRIVVIPRTVDVGGPDFLADTLGGLVRELVTIEQEVEGLPEGMELVDVTVQDDGFRARLEGEDVVVGP